MVECHRTGQDTAMAAEVSVVDRNLASLFRFHSTPVKVCFLYSHSWCLSYSCKRFTRPARRKLYKDRRLFSP